MHLIISSKAMTRRINAGYIRLHSQSHGDSRGGNDLFPDLVGDYPDAKLIVVSGCAFSERNIEQVQWRATTDCIRYYAAVVRSRFAGAGCGSSVPRRTASKRPTSAAPLALANNAESPVMQVEPDHVAK
jgi:hypothetical protein